MACTLLIIMLFASGTQNGDGGSAAVSFEPADDTEDDADSCPPGDDQCALSDTSAWKRVRWPAEPQEQIIVLDGLFSESLVQRYHQLLIALENYKIEFDRHGTPPAGKTAELHTSKDARIARMIEQICVRAAPDVVLNTSAARGSFSFSGDIELVLYRAYVNWFESGEAPWPHRDSDHRDHVTVLFYLNPTSHLRNGSCGGETMFFDDDMEVIRAVRPKPGRICIFTGRLLHSARPLLPTCSQPRLTVAVKFRARGVS